jgi:ABC-type multidrug transport system ATPase subunit
MTVIDETSELGIDAPDPSTEAVGLRVHNLVVRYDAFTLGPVSMTAESGQILCLLGPNGSGKTTLIRTTLGLQRADAGAVFWADRSLAGRPAELFARIGFVTDSAEDVIAELTPEEYWEYCALAYARAGGSVPELTRRAAELAQRLDFAPPRRSIGGFSLGMRRKTQLVAGLMHQPDLVVLDEPLVGLDFLAIRALEQVLLDERDRGALVVLSSHDLGVAARLADSIAVLHLGRLICYQPIAELTAEGAALEDEVERVIRQARESSNPVTRAGTDAKPTGGP